MIITVKKRDYTIVPTRDSHDRRAQRYANAIAEAFRAIGLTEDDFEIEQGIAFKKGRASVSWWIGDHRCYVSYDKLIYVDNLQLLAKVLKDHLGNLTEDNLDEFIDTFKENDNIEEERKKAREFFGIDNPSLEIIDKRYKALAKALHPDMPTGDLEKFKELNRHHKTLKRELE